MSDKSKWYGSKRNAPPKEGPRIYQAGDKQRQEDGHERIFGKHECLVCKVEVLRGRFSCDACQEM